jgi:hypothetical protein
MTSTLFCCGDIHLGRRPSRLPQALGEHGVSHDALTPTAAWRRLVDVAVERRPAALILAGDVVDSETARFEAFGHLKQGVEQLAAAGVKVVAVAGNHDVEALPKLADMIPDFHLLGRGGQWEGLALDGPETGAGVELLGWSFPDRSGDPDPLSALRAGPIPPSRVRVGVLHTEVDGREPRYAPVGKADLATAPVHAWLLGHLHTPTIDPRELRPQGYLGSLVGLDPTETGPRGAWELRAGPAEGGLALSRLAVSPLRWEGLELDVGTLDDPSLQLFEAVQERITALHGALRGELGEARAVGCRIRLRGRTGAGPALRLAAAEIQARRPIVPCEGVLYFVDELLLDVRPAWDLERLAEGHDPVARIARELLALEHGEPDPGLVEAAREEIRQAWAPSRDASLLQTHQPADEEVCEHLERAAARALDELLAQGEVGS